MALDEIENIINTPDKKAHSVFNKRGETTQLFYSKAKEMINDLERQSKPKNIVEDSGTYKRMK